MAKPSPKVKTRRSLVQFVRDKKREGCPICALPAEVIDQIKTAVTRKISRAEQIEWLATEYQVTVTKGQFETHVSARHEQAD